MTTIDKRSFEEQQEEREVLIKRYDRLLERARKIRENHRDRMWRVQYRIDKLARRKEGLEAYYAQAALKLEVGKLYTKKGWNETYELFHVDRLTKTGLPVGRCIGQVVRHDMVHLPFRFFEVSVKIMSRSEMTYYYRDNKLYEGSPLTALVTQGVIVDRFLELTTNMKRGSMEQYILLQKDGTPIDVTDTKVKISRDSSYYSKQKIEELTIRDAIYQCDPAQCEDMVKQLRAQGLNV